MWRITMTETTRHAARADRAEATPYVGRHARTDDAPAAGPVSSAPVEPAPVEPAPRHLVADCGPTPIRTLSARLEIARRLSTLGSPWRVLHGVALADGSLVDHLVIGPAGVFTISTKHHPSARIYVRGETFQVGGVDQPYVADARAQAGQVAELLSTQAQFDVEVRALIAVIAAPGGLTIKAHSYDGAVEVLTRKEVVPHLWSLADTLGGPSIERIHDVASRLVTSQPATVVEWSEVTVSSPAPAQPATTLQTDSPGPTATG
jgi:hypothetical protein